MAPLGFIEILDARGHVDERVAVDSFPIRLGRAYSNQVVITDPYVCPVHASIESDEQGQLLVRDLDSVNGLHSAMDDRRITSLELHSGTQFRIGSMNKMFTAVAIAQNVGTTITALLPALFTTVAPPGSTSVPFTVGSIAFADTIVAAVAAWSAQETYRLDLTLPQQQRTGRL